MKIVFYLFICWINPPSLFSAFFFRLCVIWFFFSFVYLLFYVIYFLMKYKKGSWFPYNNNILIQIIPPNNKYICLIYLSVIWREESSSSALTYNILTLLWWALWCVDKFFSFIFITLSNAWICIIFSYLFTKQQWQQS